jgi:hypothetical protein
MKNLKKLSLFFVVGLVLISAGVVIGSEISKKSEAEVINVAYDFPIRPGMDEWKTFTSHGEMLSVVQIPDKTLKQMTTRALVETCLDYPMSGDMMAHNSLQEGLEFVISGFNGLQELLKREDAGVELLAQYRLANNEIKTEIESVESGGSLSSSYLKNIFLEMLLAQDSIRGNLSKEDEKVLIKECLNNFNLRQSRPDVYSFSSSVSEILVMKKVIEKRTKKQ